MNSPIQLVKSSVIIYGGVYFRPFERERKKQAAHTIFCAHTFWITYQNGFEPTSEKQPRNEPRRVCSDYTWPSIIYMPPDISKFLINPYLVDTLSQPFSTLSRQTTALGDPLLTNGAGKNLASTHSPPPCTPGHLHSTTGRQELVTFMENQGYQWIGTAGNILLIFLLNAISRD